MVFSCSHHDYITKNSFKQYSLELFFFVSLRAVRIAHKEQPRPACLPLVKQVFLVGRLKKVCGAARPRFAFFGRAILALRRWRGVPCRQGRAARLLGAASPPPVFSAASCRGKGKRCSLRSPLPRRASPRSACSARVRCPPACAPPTSGFPRAAPPQGAQSAFLPAVEKLPSANPRSPAGLFRALRRAVSF